MGSTWNSRWLGIGAWLLRRRWWWISLTILCVFAFEFLEYYPFEGGIETSFLFEISFYGVVLPASTGLALTSLAGSRAELAWSSYYQNLKSNLDLQLNSVTSHVELASVLLPFVKVVLPLAGMTLYKYDPARSEYKLVLEWAAHKDMDLSHLMAEYRSERCSCLDSQSDNDVVTLRMCRNHKRPISSLMFSCFCIPFWFSNSPVGAARLYFSSSRMPSAEHLRLMKEVAPEIASTFQRIHLQRLMQRQGDQLSAEQQRIARDVHDSLGHSLAYLRLRLDQISMEFKQTDTSILHKEVETLRDIAKEAYDQMRELLIALSPDVDSRISNTLMKYADKISQRADFEVRFVQNGEPRTLPPLAQRNIFYIFQEALTNIEKHARARQVVVRLEWREECLQIEVMDDGLGFDSTQQTQHGHFGLVNMSERALESNGQLSISSQPGKGTHFTLSVPYEGKT